jgi:hypothetical protein
MKGSARLYKNLTTCRSKGNNRHAILTYDSSDKMSSKVYRYTIQLDSKGGCAWTSEPTVSFDESPKVVFLDPYQPIYDQLKTVKSQFPTAEVNERLTLLHDLFELLLGSPEFFGCFPQFAADINIDCWKLMQDKSTHPIYDQIYMVYILTLCFI